MSRQDSQIPREFRLNAWLVSPWTGPRVLLVNASINLSRCIAVSKIETYGRVTKRFPEKWRFESDKAKEEHVTHNKPQNRLCVFVESSEKKAFFLLYSHVVFIVFLYANTMKMKKSTFTFIGVKFEKHDVLSFIPSINNNVNTTTNNINTKKKSSWCFCLPVN